MLKKNKNFLERGKKLPQENIFLFEGGKINVLGETAKREGKDPPGCSCSLCERKVAMGAINFFISVFLHVGHPFQKADRYSNCKSRKLVNPWNSTYSTQIL